MAMCVYGAATCVFSARAESDGDAGPLVRSVWLVQRFGTHAALDPRNDLVVKGKLAKALGKDNVLSLNGVNGLIDSSTFARLAGPGGKLGAEDVRKTLTTDAPASRNRLLPKVAAHADLLTLSFDMIDDVHRTAGDGLVDWIVLNYKPGQPLDLIAVCTGNSRRSTFGATMGNIAAAYYGMPEIRFHSGGTAPTAINRRTITSLREIGVEIEPTGREAPRGEPGTANPVFRVQWGQPEPAGEPPLEMAEFSKRYDDPSNPRQNFAALLVCGEADAACPVVTGAATRIAMPYLDPKIYDDTTYESLKYAERRDDIGRLMLSVMMRVRNRLSHR
jgi:hypothetical protein